MEQDQVHYLWYDYMVAIIITITGAWFYYYEPGVSVTPSGGGVKIPLPEPYGQ